MNWTPYTKEPFFAPNFLSVPETPVFYTEFPFRTPEACFEHGGLQKTRRVPQEAVLRTECQFRTVGGGFWYRIFQTARKEEKPARKEKAIAKSAARNARVTKVVFYLLSSKFFRPKSTKSSKFICPVSVESSKSYRNFATIINRAVKLSILRCAPDTQLGFSRIGTIVPL